MSSVATAIVGLAVVAGVLGYCRFARAHGRLREVESQRQTMVKQHELLLHHAGQGIYGLDAKGCLTFVNPAAESMLGYRAGELIGRSMHPLMHHTRRDGTRHPDVLCPISQTLRDGEIRRIEDDVFWHADGSPLDVEYVVAPLIDDGAITGAVVLFSDVGERRQAIEELARWRKLIEHAGWGIAVCRPENGQMELVNPAFARLHGHEPDALRGTSIVDMLAPESKPALEETIKRIEAEGHVRFESLHQRKDGEVFPALVDLTAAPDSSGGGQYWIVNVLDISEHKSQEEKLRRSEATLRMVLERLPVGVWLANADGAVTYGNREGRRIWGGTNSADGSAADWPDAWRAQAGPSEWGLERAFKERCEVVEEILDIKHPEGGSKTILNSVFPMLGSTGRLDGAIIVNQDVTTAREADRALREREASLAQAQAQAHLGSWKLHMQDGKLEWSDECYRIFGIALGAPVDQARMLGCVHPDDRGSVDRQWQSALAGASFDVQHRIVCGGLTRWVRERAQIEFDADGAPRFALGTVQDISEIKLKEEDLLRSRQLLRDLAAHHELIREQERTRIAREIHDELGQYLTALRMDTAMIMMRFSDLDPELQRHAEGMKGTIDRTIMVVRDIAASLRPGALNMGLVSAAEWLLNGFEQRTGVLCRLDAPTEDMGLNDAQTTAVFRILQESLTNIARHAHASEIGVSFEQSGDIFRMRICDDGVGFDLGAVEDKRTFGLLGIRERALMFGGRAEIESRPGAGTTLNVSLPLEQREPVEAGMDDSEEKRRKRG
ncbi:MAG TPA: PAS domain S-box protein [Azoarcus taiwanensis]|nr:PAS domain S-box protein [Azoarcus taiwanensis]